MARDGTRANLALADFVAPKETGLADYVGGFAVTAGIGEEDVARRFERANDDYSKILVKALADRLAEAFAEALHEKVRRELWAYAPDEKLTNEQLIAEDYAGIRPAPGYPAQPDHTEKRTLFALLDAEKATGREAHRELSPCGRPLPSRDSISPIPRAAISASARSAATRSPTTRRARAGRSKRPSAGSRRSSITTPSASPTRRSELAFWWRKTRWPGKPGHDKPVTFAKMN